MWYITIDELETYKSGFDVSWYTWEELEVYIDIATELIDDYIWYSIDYNPIIDEEWKAIIKPDQQLYIKLKSTFIDTITALSVNTYWAEYIDLPLTYLNLFEKPWYFEVPLSTDFFNTGRRFTSQDKLNYKVSYTKEDKWIPNKVKLASAKIIWNLLRADYNAQNWISWSDKAVQSFTSWDYTVKLWGSSLSYQWKYNASWWATDNPYIDDWVKSLLYKLKRTRQNTY